MIPLETPKIDSFSLAIDRSKIEIMNKNITSKVLLYYYDTEDWDDELQNAKPFVYQYCGITIRLRFATRMQSQGVTKEFLIVTISSKILRERYFQGITLYNIKYIYFELMSLNVFRCSMQDFMESLVSDVDVCIDYRITLDSFIRTNKKIMSYALTGYNKFFNWFEKKKRGIFTNVGLDINTRQKARPAHPYIKNYFKSVELTQKSWEFYKEFLKPIFDKNAVSINDLGRMEYTIKNSRHKQRLLKKNLLPYEFKTLKDLLRIEKSYLKRIIYSGFEEYMHLPDYENSKEVEIKDLSPTEVALLIYQQKIIALGGTESAIFSPLENFTGTQKSRLKSKLEKIYTHLKTQNLSLKNQVQQNEEVNNFFERFRNRRTD